MKCVNRYASVNDVQSRVVVSVSTRGFWDIPHHRLGHVRPVSKTIFSAKFCTPKYYKKLSYRRDNARCVKRPFKISRSLKVICCCANRRDIYDFLLALNSNLTSIFNRSWDITSSLHLSIPHLSSRWNWKRQLGVDGHALVSSFIQNMHGLSNHKLKFAIKCTVWSQCIPVSDRQRDRRTDKPTNVMAIAHCALKWVNSTVCVDLEVLCL